MNKEEMYPIQLEEELDRWVEAGILRKTKGGYKETALGKKVRESNVHLFFENNILDILDTRLSLWKYPINNPIRKWIREVKEKNDVQAHKSEGDKHD